MKLKQKNLNRFSLLTFGFFTLYLITGIFIFRDYGVSWDEPLSRLNGIVSTNYIFSGDDYLFEYVDKDYGVIFEVPLVIIERYGGFLDNMQQLYWMRHFFTFLSFYIASIFFYLLLKHIINSSKLSLLGTTMLIFSPRIFAHSFYNSKDIPFLAVFIISIFFLLRYLQKKKLYWLVLTSFTSAILINIRIIGILLPAFFIFFTTLDEYTQKKFNIKKISISLGIYLCMFTGVTILFWPLLWRDSINNFLQAWQRMSLFPWPETVKYFGQYLSPIQLPWHYVFVWIGISIPLIYLILFLAGNIFLIKKTIQQIKKTKLKSYIIKNLPMIIAFTWVWGPLVVVTILNSNLYDEWRQLFFIYPGMVVLSIYGLVQFTKLFPKYQKLTYIITISSAILTGITMVRLHPYQNIYFNILAGNQPQTNFDYDYWGLSFKEGLEYIINTDSRPKIIIHTPQRVAKYNADTLPNDQKHRIQFTDNIQEADYYITNYRWDNTDFSQLNEIYTVKRNDIKLMGVYKLN